MYQIPHGTKYNSNGRQFDNGVSFSARDTRYAFVSNQIHTHFCFVGKSKEAEIKRINKELANIRSKFKGDKTLDGYQKKKYVCKLLFIFLLGHDIDFGHMEAVNLLSSNKYSEKQIVSQPLSASHPINCN